MIVKLKYVIAGEHRNVKKHFPFDIVDDLWWSNSHDDTNTKYTS